MTKLRWVRRAGRVACIKEMKNAYRNLFRKLQEKRPHGRHILEDNIKNAIDS
jgi:hypothetical protein